MKIFEAFPDWIIYGIIILVFIFLITLSAIFNFFKKKKLSELFEKITEKIQDLFT